MAQLDAAISSLTPISSADTINGVRVMACGPGAHLHTNQRAPNRLQRNMTPFDRHVTAMASSPVQETSFDSSKSLFSRRFCSSTGADLPSGLM
jgi:hypothetical protein